ncbi:MAG: response regulator transcription factor [Candidatus Ornithomonoglobus sp.]
MKKILMVDDEADIRRLVRKYAEREGYNVTEAADGLEAVSLCAENDFDIIIMDIMMEETDGYTACKRIKKSKDVPIIMLSAKGTEFDKLFGFEVGVDDYMVKPFSPKELMARINAIIKRCKVKSEPKIENRISFDGLQIDTLGRNVYVNGKKTDLTAKEYDLLVYFAKNNGIALTREQILDAVWGYNYFGDDRTVDWQVKLLRNKLGTLRGYLKTIRGVGYKFEA